MTTRKYMRRRRGFTTFWGNWREMKTVFRRNILIWTYDLLVFFDFNTFRLDLLSAGKLLKWQCQVYRYRKEYHFSTYEEELIFLGNIMHSLSKIFYYSVVVPYCYLFLLSVFTLWFSYYVSNIYFKFYVAEWPPIWERAVHSVYHECFRKLPSIYVFSYFPYAFEGRMWDLIVSVPDHCLSFYFLLWC